MISFVLTSVGADKPNKLVPINLRPSSSSSSSTATYSSDHSDRSCSTSPPSTACSSPSPSPTSPPAPFPQQQQQNAHIATHDPPSSSSSNTRPGEDAFPEKYAVIHQILRASDLYAVLDVDKKCDANIMRRAYMKRCKACHPDKYPSYPLATVAFQKVSFAYDIISNPSSRRMYDLHGITPDDPASSSPGINNHNFSHPSYTARADETLSGVLLGVFCDFMQGDFQMLRTFLRAMNEVNPALNISDDTIESLVSTFVRLREVLLTTQKYVRILHIELIQLYDIQHDLRSLPYLDVFGRLRLTLRLARCTLALPCAVDAMMVREAEQEEREREHERQQERKRQRLAREAATHGRARRRRRPHDVAGPVSGAAVEGAGAGEEDDIIGRGFSGTAGERRKRRPRVRTASTSGPYDDAPFPGADDEDAPDASGGGTNTLRGKRVGLLHPRVNSMIMSVCGVLEYGERMV